jgi:hypothetical protein
MLFIYKGLKLDLDLIKLGHKLYIKSLKKKSSPGVLFLLTCQGHVCGRYPVPYIGHWPVTLVVSKD